MMRNAYLILHSRNIKLIQFFFFTNDQNNENALLWIEREQSKSKPLEGYA